MYAILLKNTSFSFLGHKNIEYSASLLSHIFIWNCSVTQLSTNKVLGQGVEKYSGTVFYFLTYGGQFAYMATGYLPFLFFVFVWFFALIAGVELILLSSKQVMRCLKVKISTTCF